MHYKTSIATTQSQNIYHGTVHFIHTFINTVNFSGRNNATKKQSSYTSAEPETSVIGRNCQFFLSKPYFHSTWDAVLYSDSVNVKKVHIVSVKLSGFSF